MRTSPFQVGPATTGGGTRKGMLLVNTTVGHSIRKSLQMKEDTVTMVTYRIAHRTAVHVDGTVDWH